MIERLIGCSGIPAAVERPETIIMRGYGPKSLNPSGDSDVDPTAILQPAKGTLILVPFAMPFSGLTKLLLAVLLFGTAALVPRSFKCRGNAAPS